MTDAADRTDPQFVKFMESECPQAHCGSGTWMVAKHAWESARQVPPASVVVDVSELILLVDDLLFKQSRLGPCVEPDERDAAKEVLLQAIRVLASHLKLASDICAGWKLRHDSKCTELAKSRIKFL